MPLTPYSGYLTLVFLAGVLVLMAFDAPIGAWTVDTLIVVVPALAAGWYAVRRRVLAVAANASATPASSPSSPIRRSTRVTDDRPSSRIEHDLLGAKAVPEEAYWGVHTERAVENFPITGTTIGDYPHLVAALAAVKEAAARANTDLGLLPAAQSAAIQQACREIRDGALIEHERQRSKVQPGAADSRPRARRVRVLASR